MVLFTMNSNPFNNLIRISREGLKWVKEVNSFSGSAIRKLILRLPQPLLCIDRSPCISDIPQPGITFNRDSHNILIRRHPQEEIAEGLPLTTEIARRTRRQRGRWRAEEESAAACNCGTQRHKLLVSAADQLVTRNATIELFVHLF